MDERREFTRVRFHTEAKLSDGTREAAGEVLDLALRGAFVRCAPLFAQGDALAVRVQLHGADPELHLSVSARVVRAAADGLGLQFELEGMDIDTLNCLRHIVAYATGDPDRPLAEFCAYLKERNGD